MSVTKKVNLPWETVVGMGSYLVGDKYCNLESGSVITTTEVVCNSCGDINFALKSIYLFVKENVSFGIPGDMCINASQVLALGYGDSVTKSILFGTMTRIAKIPTRFHGYLAHTSFLSGLEPLAIFRKMPKKMLAVVPEVFTGTRWVSLGGLTMDSMYVNRLSSIFSPNQECYGYGLADCRSYSIFRLTQAQWTEDTDTDCQSKAFIDDLGIHTSIQTLIDGNSLSPTTSFIWQKFVAPTITKSVSRIRGR
jgi:hypothetical protein